MSCSWPSSLGFELVHYAAVYPELFGVHLVDDTFSDPALPMPRLLAERRAAARDASTWGAPTRAFSVYDHPMPLVFAKTSSSIARSCLTHFGQAAQGLPPPKPAKNEQASPAIFSGSRFFLARAFCSAPGG